jgi:ABC-2 type transport system ATP-binding protein
MMALEAQDLRRRFHTTIALDGLSFAVRSGTLHGLVGPDGAGKTTAIRALAGLITLDGGQAWVLGKDIAKDGSSSRALLGLMPQEASLYPDLSVAEHLRFFGRIFGLSKTDYLDRSQRLLEITRLSPFLSRRAGALSGGMYKKLGLACALLHQPKVLILDEPTVGVDPVSRRELWNLLYEFVQTGMTILLSTPYMDEAERCHQVTVIHHGHVLIEGDPRGLLAQMPKGTATSFEDLFLAQLQKAST